MTIEIQKTDHSRLSEVDPKNLGFGKIFSDHMFVADFADGAWGRARIVPYGKFEVSPALATLHYGQSIFEGMKAYRRENGDAYLFRPLDNFNRLNISAKRMAMPSVSENLFFEGLGELLRIDAEWIPSNEGFSLYLRPLLFATDEHLGVKISDTYRLLIITSPVGQYFLEPLKVLMETTYTRAVPGGAGFAKTAGNYAGSLYPTKLAQEKGYHQVIWTDSQSHTFLEESGAMNVMCVIDGTLVTPETGDTILKGITRDSVLSVAHDLGIPTQERKISAEELASAHEKGILQEMFGTGTAAIIAPICLFGYNGKDYALPIAGKESVGSRIKKQLDGIRAGIISDTHGWMYKV